MRALVMNTCQIVVYLFAVSNGQKPYMSVLGGYANKSDTAYIVCSINNTITGSVGIARNGALVYLCPIPNVCVNQGYSTEYNATQDVNSGTTTLIIRNTDKNRDGVNWTCSYRAGTPSDPVTLIVVSEANSTTLIEDINSITIELTCLFPTNLLAFEFYVEGVKYSETTPIRTGFQNCTPDDESVNYTLTFPKKCSNSYKGIFNVYIDNGFYTTILRGKRPYTLEGDPRTDETTKIVGGVLGGVAGLVCAAIGGKLIHSQYKKRNRKASAEEGNDHKKERSRNDQENKNVTERETDSKQRNNKGSTNSGESETTQ